MSGKKLKLLFVLPLLLLISSCKENSVGQQKVLAEQSGEELNTSGGERSKDKQSSRSKAASGRFEKPSPEQLRKTLTPLQYYVTQEDGTERAYANEYLDSISMTLEQGGQVLLNHLNLKIL
jgi:hypothetical protein